MFAGPTAESPPGEHQTPLLTGDRPLIGVRRLLLGARLSGSARPRRAARPPPALRPSHDVGIWQHRHAGRLTIALASRGTIEQNAVNAGEHRLDHVLMQQDREASNAYQAFGTPSAVVICTNGRIASSLAQGSVAITKLVADSTGGLMSDVRGGAQNRPTRCRPLASFARSADR